MTQFIPPKPEDKLVPVIDEKDLPQHTTLANHIIEFIQTFVVFAAIASVIYLFAIQPHKVDGCSMCPNFHTGDFILTDKVTYKFQEPKRGDVIVFHSPVDPTKDYIKRIIGLPGDTVKVDNGKVYLNGKQLDEPYLASTLQTPPGYYLQNGQEATVDKGHLIVMGDNRPQSSDSREWGQLLENQVVGKAFIRYWPLNVFGMIQHYDLQN